MCGVRDEERTMETDSNRRGSKRRLKEVTGGREGGKIKLMMLRLLYISTSGVSAFSAWEALASRPVSSLVFIKSYLTFTKDAVSE